MARILTLDDLIKRVYNKKFQSVFTCTLGANQSGKTDWNLFQMERIHALGLGHSFGANMPLEADFEIDFIEDFETLKKHCQMLNPDPERYGIKRYFFLGSEMGDWAPRDQPWLNVKFIKELQQVRKYGLSFLGDGIDRIDSRILNEKHFHGYFEKVNKARPQFAFYYDWFNRQKVKIYDIPRTSIGFNTWYSANFYMEPQLKEGARIPLNEEHELVFNYLDNGESWKKIGIHPQTGKDAVRKVLRYHRTHCLHTLQEPNDDSAPLKSERHRDMPSIK